MLSHINTYISTHSPRRGVFSIIAGVIATLGSLIHAESATSTPHGIIFRGNDCLPDSRTSIVIPATGAELKWDKELTVDFDVKISRDGDHFGHIATVKFSSGHEVSVMLTNPKDGAPYICVVEDGGRIKSLVPNSDVYTWNHITLDVTRQGDSLCIKTNGQPLASHSVTNHGKILTQIIFGKNDISDNPRLDVAPMEMRDIVITSGPEENQQFRFPLKKSLQDSIIMDTSGRLNARLSKHEWVVDAHSKWKLMRTLSLPEKAYPVYTPGSTNLYLVLGNKVITVNLVKNRVKECDNSTPINLDRLTNQFIVVGNFGHERLFYYTSDVDESPVTSQFDFEDGRWQPAIRSKSSSNHFNHSHLWRPMDSTVIQLFGYGYHLYNNNIDKIDLHKGVVSRDSFARKTIAPRYLSATGMVAPETALIYGGVGNQYGNQEFGIHLFHDLWSMDINTCKPVHLLDTKGNPNEIAATSLVADIDSGKVAALFYNPFKSESSLVLKSIDLSTGELQCLSDSLRYPFHDMTSSANLLHPAGIDILYAVTVFRTLDGHYQVDIYSIRLPILNTNDVKSLDADGNGIVTALVVAGLLFILIAFVTILAIKNRKIVNKEPRRLVEEPVEDFSVYRADGIVSPTSDISVDETPNTSHQFTPSEPGIYLLGSFKAVAADGTNISDRFTPILRQLLALIILYTERNGGGISNSQLKDYLWLDKSEESFLNNRSVNMRKLRILLELIGDIHINASHGNWGIETNNEKSSKSTTIDYIASMALLHRLKQGVVEITPGIVNRLVEFAACGTLLPAYQLEWLDQFKSDYSDLMIEGLHKLLADAIEKNNHNAVVRIANSIAVFDPIDEYSVKEKCRALIQTHRSGAASKAYRQFTSEYKVMMGVDFPQSFNDFIA